MSLNLYLNNPLLISICWRIRLWKLTTQIDYYKYPSGLIFKLKINLIFPMIEIVAPK